MLSDHSCLSCLWRWCIVTKRMDRMPLGMEGGLGPGHIVVDGNPAPPSKKGHSPPILGQCLLWQNGWTDRDATWYGGRPHPKRHYVRWGPSSPRKRAQQPPAFQPMSILPKWSHLSSCGAIVCTNMYLTASEIQSVVRVAVPSVCVRVQSFVSERSTDQDLGCIDRFSCKLDDLVQTIQSFGSGTWHFSVLVAVLPVCCCNLWYIVPSWSQWVLVVI